MVLIAMTGANGDVGVEACRQLVAVDEVTKILITCRSKEKAETTISTLVTKTGKDASMFDYLLLDLTDLSSIDKAIEDFPKVDRLCLNAGMLGKCKYHMSGVVDCMVANTLGHAVLVDGLIKAEKITAGSRVVYVGSEISRFLWGFQGLNPTYYSLNEEDIKSFMNVSFKDSALTGFLPIRAQLGDYKHSKIIGQMHFSHMAKENPDIHFMTISPGAIHGEDGKGTGFTSEAEFPVKQMMKIAPGLFKFLGMSHGIEPGCARYVDGVLTGETKWETGAMVMSGKSAGIFWGAKGPVIDNRPHIGYLADESLCEKAAEATREWSEIWKKAVNTATV